MKTENIDFSKIGTSIVCKEFQNKMRAKAVADKNYWEYLQDKKGNHLVVKNMLWNMQELSKEFLIMPRFLEQFFFLYLNEKHPSQQNKQLALNVARVFAVLSHQYYKSATNFNMVSSFWVSPSVWDKFLVGRKAKDNSIAILEKMGLIISYRFNRNKFAPAENSRFVIMYQFNVDKVKWLHACVKTLSALEDTRQEETCEERERHFSYADITDDLFGFIEQTE